MDETHGNEPPAKAMVFVVDVQGACALWRFRDNNPFLGIEFPL
jgi:hypothetical protein